MDTTKQKRSCVYQKPNATLDTHHNEKLQGILEAQSMMQELQNIKRDVERQLDDEKLTLQEKNQLKLVLTELKDRIKSTSEEADEIKYYTNVADILFNYYTLLESNHDENIPQKKSILDIFWENSNGKRKSAKKNTDENVEGSENAPSSLCRASLLDSYLAETDVDYINDNLKHVSVLECPYCDNKERQMFINEGLVHCSKCSTIEHIINDNDKPSYKEPPKEISYFAYARINHFVEWLNNIQGKETTNINDEVFDNILLELKKYRVTNLTVVKKNMIKDILKKLKLNKYYEHTPYIWNRITGLPNPHFTPELEEKLKNMFKELQVPYLKFSPPKRKNFLSYSYTLHKLLGILGETKLMKHFHLLKNREKLHQQEQIWKNICEYLGWEFIRSI